MTSALLVGAVFGLGVLLVVRGFVPPRADLAATIGRWELARAQASRPTGTSRTPQDRAGRWLHAQMTRRGLDLGDLRADLQITGRTPEQWLGRVLLTALAGLLTPTVLGALGSLLGMSFGLMLPLAFGLLLAAVGVAAEIAGLQSEARDKRAELLQALATYLDLFSMCLAGVRGVPEAMALSSRIGRGWAFELIQDTLTQARRSGVTPWQALGELGDRVGLHELVDLSSALTLVGDSGARVRASLSARAGTLRRRQLADAAADAGQADDSMRISQLLMAAGFMVLIGFPAVMNVLAI